MEIKVTRGELLQSQAALGNLGRVSLPVQKDGYWLVKTLAKINAAVKRELKAAQKESNRLLEELGEDVLDKDGNRTGQRGIAQTNVESMNLYSDAMEQFNSEFVALPEVSKVKLSVLEEGSVSMTLADQASLLWLFQE